MNDERNLDESNELKDQQKETKKDETAAEGEFKVTVRKLDLPVRPRGVLADG
jgi:hypothetical protein